MSIQYIYDISNNYYYPENNNIYPTITSNININNLLGSLLFNGTFNNAINVGNYTINPYNLYSPNYLISYFSGTLSITKKEIFVIANNITKNYDGLPILNNITVTYSPDISSNEITGTLLNIGTSYNSINIGTYNIIPSNLESINYKLIYVPGILTILQSNNNIIINILYVSKYYDRTNLLNNNLQVNINYTVSGNILIDYNNFILTYTGYFITSTYNIGLYSFNLSNISLSLFGNYFLIQNFYTYIGQILPKPVYLIFSGVNKIYDGTTSASIIFIGISGIIYPDIINVLSYKYNFIDSNFGINKKIIIYDISLDNINYYALTSYTYANITYPITINLNLKSLYIIYGNTNDITITINPILSVIPIDFTSLIDIYQNFIISSNTIYNLNNNLLSPVITLSNLIFTSINLNIISTTNSVIYTNNNYITYNITYIGNYNFTCVTQIINNIGFIIGLSGIIFKTINSGLSWTIINSNVNNNLNNIYLINENILFIVCDNGLLLVSYDSGITFNNYIISSYNLNSIFMVNQYYGFIVTSRGTVYSTLNGIIWNLIYTCNYCLNDIFVYNINNIYITGNNGIIIYSFNRGITWSNFISGTNLDLLKLYMFSLNNIYIIGANLILYYNINPGGTIQLFNNLELLYSIAFPSNISSLSFNYNNLNIGKYYLYAKYIPNNYNLYSITYSNISILIIKPIIYYNPFLENIIIPSFNQTISSSFPIIDISNKIIDHSGGIFYTSYYNSNIILNYLTGQFIFLSNISIDQYIIPVTYILNDISNTTNYNLIVNPNIYYTVNIINLLYGISGKSILPYTNPSNGSFIIIDISNNLVSNNLVNIDSSGIIYFSNNINSNYYTFKILYTFNNITNSTNYYLNLQPVFYYSPNTTIINYSQNYSKSGIPYISNYNKNISFSINFNQSIFNNIYIDISGIIYFNNLIVGFYTLTITCFINSTFNTTLYYLYVYPLLNYNPSFLSFNYNQVAIISSPNINPYGGIFNILDISGNLVSNNNIIIDLSGNLNFNNSNINIGLYSIIVNYLLNNLSVSFILNIEINSIIYYNNSIFQYNQYINSIIPNIIPSIDNNNNSFKIIALDNLLVQLNLIKINNFGIIDISNYNIPPNIYNFQIQYFKNNVISKTNFILTIIPYLSYNPNSLTLLNNYSGNSIIPIYSPDNGLFSISGNLFQIKNNLFQIKNNGQIIFNSNIPPGTYIITVLYNVNNLFNYFNYYLNVTGILPVIYYSIPNTTILYDTSGNSIIPYINIIGGIF